MPVLSYSKILKRMHGQSDRATVESLVIESLNHPRLILKTVSRLRRLRAATDRRFHHHHNRLGRRRLAEPASLFSFISRRVHTTLGKNTNARLAETLFGNARRQRP